MSHFAVGAAAEAAICNPLIDNVSLRGARGVLISITGGKDLTLYEVDEAATRIREEVDADANIIVGATFDDGAAVVLINSAAEPFRASCPTHERAVLPRKNHLTIAVVAPH